jgi:hypothetical protein
MDIVLDYSNLLESSSRNNNSKSGGGGCEWWPQPFGCTNYGGVRTKRTGLCCSKRSAPISKTKR